MVDVKTRIVYNDVSRQTPFYRGDIAEIFINLNDYLSYQSELDYC